MKTIKKVVPILVLVAAVTAIIVSIAAMREITVRGTMPSESQTVKAPLYTLKSVENKVYVYKNGADTPEYQIEEIQTFALPEKDQRLLKIGIEVYSTDALSKLIEDLES